MNKVRKVDTRENVRTVTSNNFITAKGLEKLSIKARKLLYIAISQCKMSDKEFYEYSISVKDFSELMDIDSSNVYDEADKLTDELMKGILKTTTKGGNSFKKYSLFSKCEYEENSELRFKLNSDMTDFLLKLKGNFTKPLLDDFMKMNSPYSMAVWHLMQREMHSCKPCGTDTIKFDISLEELREATGTQNKLEKLSNFKNRVLDKALREIKDNCGIDINYTNIKKGRTVVGFRFSAFSKWHIDEDKIPEHIKNRAELFKLKQKAKTRELTSQEQAEYNRLIKKSEQIELSF